MEGETENMDLQPLHFIGEEIEVMFNKPSKLEKSPECPAAFTWRGEEYRVVNVLSEKQDFTRRGRMARNMSDAHHARAVLHGSWGVGRFFFRVEVAGGRFFELYYDRAPEDSDNRKGNWFLKSEMISSEGK